MNIRKITKNNLFPELICYEMKLLGNIRLLFFE